MAKLMEFPLEFYARITDKEEWPRKWWWPTSYPPPDDIQDAKEIKEYWQAQHNEISITVRRTTLGFLSYCVFCIFTLGAPDVQLATNMIKAPFANTNFNFMGFIRAGPIRFHRTTLV